MTNIKWAISYSPYEGFSGSICADLCFFWSKVWYDQGASDYHSSMSIYYLYRLYYIVYIAYMYITSMSL